MMVRIRVKLVLSDSDHCKELDILVLVLRQDFFYL